MVSTQQRAISHHPFFITRDTVAASATLARPLNTTPIIINSSRNGGNNCSSSSLTEVIPGLFIGNVRDAARVLFSDHHEGITHILSLASSDALSSLCAPLSTPCAAGAHRLEIAKRGLPLLRMVKPLLDVPEENILPVLQPCFDFIDEGRRRTGGKVLVHCLAGVSRSAAVVTAYLMRTCGLTPDKALHLLNERYNHKASPNPGFLKQLQFFETQLLLEQKEEAGERANSPSPRPAC